MLADLVRLFDSIICCPDVISVEGCSSMQYFGVLQVLVTVGISRSVKDLVLR
jgi:hypothetical protein